MDWNQLLSPRRLGRAEPPPLSAANDTRTDYQRDYDRIIFSSALRRMQDKTQVFPLASNDYVRTRLTHSLEVASVGRTLGMLVGDSVLRRHRLANIQPQDLGAIVAAACLAHDIGNPPFGHAGEDAMREWFRDSELGQRVLDPLSEAQRQDFLRFEGNAQGFRLLVRLQNPDNPGGLQLTCATLATFSKYPCDSLAGGDINPPGATWRNPVAHRKFGFVQDDQPLFAQVADGAGLPPLSNSDEGHAWVRHPLAYLVEAADDICYLIIDIEDAFRLRRLTAAEATALLRPLVTDADMVRMGRLGRAKERIEFLRAKAIATLIDQAYQQFVEHEEAILQGRFASELLGRVPAASALIELKAQALEKVYYSPEVVEVGAAGFEVLGGLLQAFVAAAEDCARHGIKVANRRSGKSRMLMHLLPTQFGGAGSANEPAWRDPYRRLLGITDFIAGMTDSYAVGLYKKITGISLPGGG